MSVLLALEAGNTRVHFARFEGGRILAREQAETADPESAVKAAGWFRECCEGKGGAAPRALWASVVPAWSDAFRARLREGFLGSGAPAPRELLPETTPFSFERSYAEPRLFGIDRALSCEGALAHGRACALLVVQAGTATTVDGLSPPDRAGGAWKHKGGAIAPGLALSAQALARGGARLPAVALHEMRTPELWGKSPETAIAAGILGGQAAMIRGFAEELVPHGEPVRIALTGGAASLLLPWLRSRTRNLPVEIDDLPDLALQGIARIHERLG